MLNKYDLLLEYFYKERNRLENDIEQLQENLRYRRVSSVDCLELIIAKERLSAFLEYSEQVKAILKLRYTDKYVGYREEDFDEKTE